VADVRIDLSAWLLSMTETLPAGAQPQSSDGDVLHGAPRIAAFLFGNTDKAALRRTRALISGNRLPVFRFGGEGAWCAEVPTASVYRRARGSLSRIKICELPMEGQLRMEILNDH
jgi:hypothetical protein